VTNTRVSNVGKREAIFRENYRVRQKVYPLDLFCSFLSNLFEFHREILATYLVILYAHYSLTGM